MNTVVSGSYDDALKNVCLTLCNYADAVKNFKEPSGTIRADSFEPRSGRATVYQYQNGNALLDDYVKEHELYVCALTKTGTRAESDDYANYAGGMIEITYGSKTITALVADSMQLDTDKNTTRKKGDVDLDPDAFKALTGATTGEFDITWKIVPNTAAENGNVQYRIKEGSNTGWAAVQPRNTVYPVAKLEYKVGSGSYKEAELKEFFHYVIEPGSSAVSFRMTDIFGKEIEEKDVNLGLTGTNSASAAVVDGTVQFPK
jgi:expansin (peptidoglycan-binding protein)